MTGANGGWAEESKALEILYGGRAERLQSSGPPPPAGNGANSLNQLNQRVGRLEIAVSGLHGDLKGIKHVQIVLVAVVLGVGALLYNSVSSVESRIDALPDRLTAIANSISNAVTASRNQQPIIINVPSGSGAAKQTKPPPDNAVSPSGKK